jgi:hypothetical protein
MTLEADFAALLTELAESAAPLDLIDDWFDAHAEEAFQRGAATYELRTCVQDALAIGWRVRRRYLSDAVARSRLRELVERLGAGQPD